MTVRRRRSFRSVASVTAATLIAAGLSALAAQPAQASTVPSGFTDTVAIGGLTNPTAVVFGPNGRVFIAEKSGLIKTYDSLADTTPTTVADLRPRVHDFWDRGLLGLAVDPSYPTRPYLYALYALDAEPGGTYPRWGDGCPNPPGATTDGCLITGQLSRLTLDANHVMTGEQLLITDWCQQFPSHSIGTVAFGPDGYLYVSGGDGASFNYVDYGQTKNPCGDPPLPAGSNLSPPAAEGGALRSQSVRRPASEPVLLDGTVLRIDPDTGLGAPGNPFASSTDANKRRVIAYGLRNPFRFTVRPGTSELWVGDVGWSTWEDINRIPVANDATAENFGWPCYEGPNRQSGYDGANLNLCESLYAPGDPGHNAPYFTYNHSTNVVPGDGCPTANGSSITGLAFENGSTYPAEYRSALFFSDYSRRCIWAMKAGADGLPDPGQIVPFVVGGMNEGPVQVVSGPGGDIFYVAMNTGELRRVSYPTGNRPPTAVASATPSSGNAPLTVQFDGTGSFDPDGDTLGYAWDLDADGAYDDSTAAQPTYTYTSPGNVPVGLRVTDPAGASGTTTVTVTVGQPPSDDPVPVIDTPSPSLHWVVGQTISFSGHATDPQDGTLPASALSWQLNLEHCPSGCHTHVLQTFPGVASGSFTAPDHDYPSHLELILTATDSSGRTASTMVRLDPQTVTLNFATTPTAALQLVVNGTTLATPFTRTVIVGSANSLTAPTPQTAGKWAYTFGSWSDGGAQTHLIVAPATGTTYTAKYNKCTPGRPC
ncbi:MAG TPA: PQQ-dependent sugar dehydrogenase [Pseudonocardiaceae bacterium]